MADGDIKSGQTGIDLSHSAHLPPEMEVNLSDDKPAPTGDFTGATLKLDAGAGVNDEVEFKGPGLQRDRPYSSSMISRKSTTSTKSKTSMSPGIHSGNFEKAVEDVQGLIIKADLDGSVTGAWVLTEIDHWDNEKERLVVLTEKSVLVIKYDFIAGRCGEFRRIMFHIIDTIHIGDLTYPAKSIMPPRQHGGVRFSWDKGQGTTFGQRWNPFATNIPYVTLSHHPLAYTEKEKETITYNVDDFYESLLQAVTNVYKEQHPGSSVNVIEGPIEIESYASIASLVFNQSHLGFNRERNGVSF